MAVRKSSDGPRLSTFVLRQVAKALVPESLRPGLRRIGRKVRHFGSAKVCSACGSHVRRFLPHGTPPESDFLCPVCWSKPPHRLAARYFQTHPKIFTPDGLLIHIAPEPEMRKRLAEYTTKARMSMRWGGITGTGEHHLDLFSLPFADNSVHVMYCCHVLNSLQDDRAAMREVYRVMHPDGLALLQVPAFHKGETTLETNGLAERMALFADAGIFRCYTDADYVARLHDSGFEVSKFQASELPADTTTRHELKREVLHICRKLSSKPRSADLAAST